MYDHAQNRQELVPKASWQFWKTKLSTKCLKVDYSMFPIMQFQSQLKRLLKVSEYN